MPFSARRLHAWIAACIVAASVPCQAAPPPLAISLDSFEARKSAVALPNGESIAYLEYGAKIGRPVLLVHGYTDSAQDWIPLLPFLDPNERLIVVDIRGHGRSGKPECCYSRFDFAYDLKLLLDSLKLSRVDLVGHSLGSIIAQTFGELWPERTRRVVLISSTAQRVELDLSAIRELKDPIDPDSEFMLTWWSSPTPVNEELVRRQRLDSARIPARVWIAVLDQALGDADLRSMLARLTAPTLLIWGSEDFIMREAERNSLRGALPSAQVKIFEGLGHNPFWEDPKGVAEVINRFLATN